MRAIVDNLGRRDGICCGEASTMLDECKQSSVDVDVDVGGGGGDGNDGVLSCC